MHHGKTLRSVLDELSLKTSDFAVLIGKGESTIRQWYTEKELSRDKLALIVFLLGISPSRFDLPANNFDTPFNQRNQCECITHHSYITTASNDNSGYHKQIERVISKAARRIWIHNYIPYRRNTGVSATTETYIKRQEKYFQNIENQLDAHPMIQYRRVLVLPAQSLADTFLTTSRESKYRALYLAIAPLSKQKLQHIKTCLTKFETTFRLYVRLHAENLYDYAVVDDVLAIELDRYSHNNSVRPDELFTFPKNNEIVYSYADRLSDILAEGETENPPTWPITADDIEAIIDMGGQIALDSLDLLLEKNKEASISSLDEARKNLQSWIEKGELWSIETAEKVQAFKQRLEDSKPTTDDLVKQKAEKQIVEMLSYIHERKKALVN